MKNVKDYKFLFCIGAQKSGTTFLYELLRQHEGICFSTYKELHFFSDRIRSKKSIDVFYKSFEPKPESVYLADFTPEYLYKAEAVENISRHFKSNSKIIIIMRDPVKRAFSNYNMKFSIGKEERTFHDLVIDGINSPEVMDAVIGKGLYAKQLDVVYSNFDKEQIFLLTFERLINNQEKVMRDILAFLNLDEMEFNYDVQINTKKKTRVSGLGKLFYKIPLRTRRWFFPNLNFLKKALWMVMLRTSKPIKKEIILEKRTKDLLSEYYKESNERVRDNYGVNISEWM